MKGVAFFMEGLINVPYVYPMKVVLSIPLPKSFAKEGEEQVAQYKDRVFRAYLKTSRACHLYDLYALGFILYDDWHCLTEKSLDQFTLIHGGEFFE